MKIGMFDVIAILVFVIAGVTLFSTADDLTKVDRVAFFLLYIFFLLRYLFRFITAKWLVIIVWLILALFPFICFFACYVLESLPIFFLGLFILFIYMLLSNRP